MRLNKRRSEINREGHLHLFGLVLSCTTFVALNDFSDSERVISLPLSHIVGCSVVRGDQSAKGSPWIELLGHSFGFVPFFSLNECVYGVLNEVQVEVELSSLKKIQKTFCTSIGPRLEDADE